ncbi:hypothetical protein ElyMa_007051100 [Elysia marginata]|uniref:Protein kinase domain-containing protein n=1 Tax=Elysia marginata TaxID=1093978 RepID=A0AAV4JWH9_9GAST|nr:hypothetical protein ElyMa_007051100 [Elysia marginata]
MATFYRRRITYILMCIPLVAYLVLAVCLLTRVCPRSGVDRPQTDFQAKYEALVKLLKDQALARHFNLDTDNIGSDLRKLLDVDAESNVPGYHTAKNFDKEFHKLVQESVRNIPKGGDSGLSGSERNSETFRDSNVHIWHVEETKMDSDLYAGFQDIHKDDSRYPSAGYPLFIHNCSSISDMRIRAQLGHGVSKQAFVADYKGAQVVIKMVTRHVAEVKNCLKRLREVKTAMSSPKESVGNTYNMFQSKEFLGASFKASNLDGSSKSTAHPVGGQSGVRVEVKQTGSAHELLQVELTPAERQSCYIPSTARVMKEILMSQQLQHPNLASLLGYCVRSEESDTTDISEHGVISVFELGSRFVLDSLQVRWRARREKSLIEYSGIHLKSTPLKETLA